MSQQNTALIDDIMAALDAESSQNVELIVRNTQNGATKKMALASLEQIIYSYLTTAPVVTNLASVLGVYGLSSMTRYQAYNGDMNDIKENAWGYTLDDTTNTPSGLNSRMSFISLTAWFQAPIQIMVSDNGFAVRRFLFATWSQWTVVKR